MALFVIKDRVPGLCIQCSVLLFCFFGYSLRLRDIVLAGQNANQLWFGNKENCAPHLDVG